MNLISLSPKNQKLAFLRRICEIETQASIRMQAMLVIILKK